MEITLEISDASKFDCISYQLVVALGTYQGCYEIIDSLYKEDEYKYHKLYLNSPYYNDKIKELFQVKSTESINKLIGMMAWYEKNNSILKIEEIIKCVNPSIIKYVKNKPIVMVDKFIKTHYNIDNTGEHELFVIATCLVYLSTVYKKDYGGRGLDAMINGYWGLFIDSICKNDHLYEIRECNYEKIRKFYELLDIDPNKDLNMNMDSILSNIVEKEVLSIVEEKIGRFAIDNQLIPIDVYQDCRNEAFAKGISKYIGSLSGLCSSFGLDTNSIFTEYVDKKLMDGILNQCATYQKYNGLTHREIPVFIFASIYIATLIRMYKEIKYLYLNKSEENKYKDLIELENKIKSERLRIQTIEDEYHSELTSKDNEIKRLQEQIKALNAENRELHSLNEKSQRTIVQLKEESDIKTEKIDILNEIINDVTPYKDQTVSTDDMIDFIKGFKIAMFGGHNTTRNKIQSSIPNILLFDNKNSDITSVKDCDYVFINADWFSHSFNFKITSFCRKNNINYKYIGGTNYEIAINSIYQTLKTP